MRILRLFLFAVYQIIGGLCSLKQRKYSTISKLEKYASAGTHTQCFIYGLELGAAFDQIIGLEVYIWPEHKQRVLCLAVAAVYAASEHLFFIQRALAYPRCSHSPEPAAAATYTPDLTGLVCLLARFQCCTLFCQICNQLNLNAETDLSLRFNAAAQYTAARNVEQHWHVLRQQYVR